MSYVFKAFVLSLFTRQVAGMYLASPNAARTCWF